MRKYERYEKYKDSGIEWIGEIPESWNVEKIKNIADFISRGTTPDYNERGTYKVVNQATFSKGFFDETNIRFHNSKNKQIQKKELKQNDILLASTGGGVLGKSFFFEKNVNNYIADSHVTIIRDSKNRFNPKFLFYFFSINYNLIEGYLGQGSTNQTEIQRQWLRHLYIPFPPIKTQNKIVQYLDKKQKQANTFIEKQKKIIELLKEKKKAIINEAITKGINKDVKMKDSGVEWIGEIPEDWEVRKLSTIFNFISRGTTPDYTEKSEIKVVNQATFSKGYFDETNIRFHKKATDKNEKGKLKYKDILLASTGGGVLGKSSIFLKKTGNYLADSHVTIIRDTKKKAIPEYFYYFFHINFELFEGYFGQGSTNQTEIQSYWLKEMEVPYPSTENQQMIVNFLREKLPTIEKFIKVSQRKIDLVKEYMESLTISSISGKFKLK